MIYLRIKKYKNNHVQLLEEKIKYNRKRIDVTVKVYDDHADITYCSDDIEKVIILITKKIKEMFDIKSIYYRETDPQNNENIF